VPFLSPRWYNRFRQVRSFQSARHNPKSQRRLHEPTRTCRRSTAEGAVCDSFNHDPPTTVGTALQMEFCESRLLRYNWQQSLIRLRCEPRTRYVIGSRPAPSFEVLHARAGAFNVPAVTDRRSAGTGLVREDDEVAAGKNHFRNG
jgi:hypothetical protein